MKVDRAGLSSRLALTDGLRAVAVLAVVLFHVFPAQVPGGFIGVDIFFVISGFVIANRYVDQLVSREIGLSAFFVRRVRRLLPAYALFIAVTAAVAFFLLPPDLLIQFGASLAAQALYVQNITFMVQGDYFFAPTDKPLLHTWSLAVEEQFYLIFPLLILALRRWPGRALLIFALLGLGSLASGHVVAGVSARAAFYLLPFRVWEFVAGIAVAHVYASRRQALSARPRLANAMFAGSILALLATIMLFDSRADAAGVHGLLAVAATSLILFSQDGVTAAAGWGLRNPVAQHFGRISYSWYLWHWPLISFYAVSAGHPHDPTWGLAILVVGYAAGYLSWRFVEQLGLRSRMFARPGPAFSALGGFLGAAAIAGAALIWSNGAVFRYSASERPYVAAAFDRPGERCGIVSRLRDRGSSICARGAVDGPGGLLVIGDSYSNMLRATVVAAADRHRVPIYYTTDICRPAAQGPDVCSERYWARLEKDIARKGISKVFLVVHWPARFTAEQYAQSVRRIRSFGVELYVLQSPPEADVLDPSYPLRSGTAARLPAGFVFSSYSRADYERDHRFEIAAMRSLARADRGVHVVDATPVLCPRSRCVFAFAGRPIRSDSNHLNSTGEALLTPVLEQIFAGGR